MTTQFTRFTQFTTVDASNWEPDGVTLQVRFCEGGSAYHENEIAAATLQTAENFASLLDNDFVGQKILLFASSDMAVKS